MTLYTDTFVISGTIQTRQRRLSDILNFADDEFIVIGDAVLEGLGGRGPRHAAQNAQVNLGAVLLAVSQEEVEPLPGAAHPEDPRKRR